MAVYRLVLILTAALLAAATASADSMCLKCHKDHYAQLSDCVSCHHGNNATPRQDIAHHGIIPGRYVRFMLPGDKSAERGSKLTEKLACRRCHLLNGSGGRLASDLDDLIRTSEPGQWEQSIENPVPFMPYFQLSREQRTDIINAILMFGSQASRSDTDTPLIVHFEENSDSNNPFEKFCGRCHKVISPVAGGLGVGTTGPNLTGLLGPNYPPISADGKRWTSETLVLWLENPRKVRPLSTMPPVLIKEKELADILEILQEPDGSGDAITK